MMGFSDPRFVVAYTIILGFTAAYINDPSETMNGALIAAFAGAWGYYLGSSSSSHTIREQVGQALNLATSALPPKPKTTTVSTVTTETKPNQAASAQPVDVVAVGGEPVEQANAEEHAPWTKL